MAKFKIRPYDDYDAWDSAETIEEARDKRVNLLCLSLVEQL